MELISVALGGKIASYHQSNLKRDCIVKFSEVKSCQFFDFIQAVNESISVNEHFSRGFGNVQIVCKEALNRGKRFSVQSFDGAFFENFVEEHFAKCGGKLIDQSANAEIIVADDGFIRIEHTADFESCLCFAVRETSLTKRTSLARSVNSVDGFIKDAKLIFAHKHAVLLGARQDGEQKCNAEKQARHPNIVKEENQRCEQ